MGLLCALRESAKIILCTCTISIDTVSDRSKPPRNDHPIILWVLIAHYDKAYLAGSVGSSQVVWPAALYQYGFPELGSVAIVHCAALRLEAGGGAWEGGIGGGATTTAT